ncbi:hypothetical protein M5689_005258 [Euphorbia peplus]|nr:hypothetical protein M5689_005258 [Euphorbia peplus]
MSSSKSEASDLRMSSSGGLDLDLDMDGLSSSVDNLKVDDSPELTCFTEIVNDVALHFQIIRLPKQIYAWVSSNSCKFGHLYAAAPTRPNNTPSVSCLLGGTSDNVGSGIARRLVLKTGLNILLACNIPNNTPMLEASAERKLVEKLIHLGYTKPKAANWKNQSN